MTNPTVSSMLPAMRSGRVTVSSVTSRKPPAVISRVSRSPSANANGPGAPGGPRSGARPTWATAAPTATATHSLLSGSCQHTNTSRPPGRSAWARLANAVSGSSKNIVLLLVLQEPAGPGEPTTGLCEIAFQEQGERHPEGQDSEPVRHVRRSRRNTNLLGLTESNVDRL